MEDGKSRQSWNNKRHGDPPPDGKLRPAIDARRLDKLIGKTHEELPHQECAEAGHQPGEGNAPIGIDPAKASRHHIPGNYQHFGRDHQRAENGDEDDLATAKIKLGQRVADQRIKKQHGRRAEGGDPQGIQHPAQEFRFLQDEHVVFQRRPVGNDTQLENLLARLERR